MNIILTIAIIGLAIMVLVSLVRGIVAFLQTTRRDIDGGIENSQEMQLKQNQAMFARIKYQALAIVAVAILLAINS